MYLCIQAHNKQNQHLLLNNMPPTRTLVRQIGRKSIRCLSTSRYPIFNKRQATFLAMVGISSGFAWWQTTKNVHGGVTSDNANANEPLVVREPLVVHRIEANQPSTSPIKVVKTATANPVDFAVASADSMPSKRIVGGNYTAAKKHSDDEDDEKWFTC